MRILLREIDILLRGGYSRPADLREGKPLPPARRLIAAGLLLGVSYGTFMGLYALIRLGAPGLLQMASAAIKVPALFLLTLSVTFPSLYVFSAIADSKLRCADTLRLLLMGIVVDLALLASFGPVTGFFTLSTESYPFMVLLNVVFFAAGGIAGVAFVRRALESILAADSLPPPVLGGKTRFTPRANLVFSAWIFIFAVVGAQMGWILRPFVGSPEDPFTLFRSRQSNFFEAVARAVLRLLR